MNKIDLVKPAIRCINCDSIIYATRSRKFICSNKTCKYGNELQESWDEVPCFCFVSIDEDVKAKLTTSMHIEADNELSFQGG